MIKLIIFDFDGPILDSFQSAIDSISACREKMAGILPEEKLPEPTKETITTCWGYPGLITLSKIFPLLEEREIREFADEWIKTEKGKNMKFIEGALKTLENLKKNGYHTGLLTSRSNSIKKHLKDVDLEKVFDFIQTWSNPEEKSKTICQNHFLSSHYKPSGQVFKNIFRWTEQKGISEKEMVLIDDSLVGLKAAKEVGISFLGVCTGPLKNKESWKKYGGLEEENVLNSIIELPRWLEKHSCA